MDCNCVYLLVVLPPVIIEDTLSMFKEFISSQTVRKNYYPPVNNLESDYFRFLDRARHCVLAGFVVLIELVASHEEKLVEKFGSDVLLLVEHHVELCTFEISRLWARGV